MRSPTWFILRPIQSAIPIIISTRPSNASLNTPHAASIPFCHSSGSRLKSISPRATKPSTILMSAPWTTANAISKALPPSRNFSNPALIPSKAAVRNIIAWPIPGTTRSIGANPLAKPRNGFATDANVRTKGPTAFTAVVIGAAIAPKALPKTPMVFGNFANNALIPVIPLIPLPTLFSPAPAAAPNRATPAFNLVSATIPPALIAFVSLPIATANTNVPAAKPWIFFANRSNSDPSAKPLNVSQSSDPSTAATPPTTRPFSKPKSLPSNPPTSFGSWSLSSFASTTFSLSLPSEASLALEAASSANLFCSVSASAKRELLASMIPAIATTDLRISERILFCISICAN